MGMFALRDFQAGETVLPWDTSLRLAKDALNDLSDNERLYTHPFDENTVIVVQPPERLANHSCGNNIVVRKFCDVAVRNTSAGEEITSDYSTDGSGLRFRCFCGDVNCQELVS
jgi:hypothetical protein